MEFKEEENSPFDEILEVLRKYPDFQKYELEDSSEIFCAGLRIVPSRRKVYGMEKEIHLTARGFPILKFFVANVNRVLSYKQIYEQIWGEYDQAIENNSIGSHICRLRRKLYAPFRKPPFCIRTVREVGYCFEIN